MVLGPPPPLGGSGGRLPGPRNPGQRPRCAYSTAADGVARSLVGDEVDGVDGIGDGRS